VGETGVVGEELILAASHRAAPDGRLGLGLLAIERRLLLVTSGEATQALAVVGGLEAAELRAPA
jgi:hypothetical protein